MAPSKWDEEEETSSGSESETSPPPVAARRKFDDEEDSDEVLESWDAAEDSEAEREKAKKAAAAKAKAEAEEAANKKSKAQRIEEHREANRRRRAAEEEEESSEEDEDDFNRRARLRKSEQDADLKHAQDLLENTGLGAKTRSTTNKATVIEDKNNPGQTIDLAALSLFKPATKTQFDNLSAVLVPLLVASSSRPHYSLWAQEFVKKICVDMPSTEIKKAASGLTALSNEKMKEEKAQEKTGKKSKAAKSKATLVANRSIGRGLADTHDYGGDELGDDDFM